MKLTSTESSSQEKKASSKPARSSRLRSNANSDMGISPAKKFKVPIASSIGSSPSVETRFRTYRTKSEGEDHLDSDDAATAKSVRPKSTSERLEVIRSRIKQKQDPTDVDTPAPKKAFRLPSDDLPDVETPGSDSGLSSVPDSDFLEQEGEDLAHKNTSVCPMCKKVVDPAVLQDFSKGRKMNVQKQTAFCREHNRLTALATWLERGYPEINWAQLEKRLEFQRPFLYKVIQTGKSYYADKFAESVKSGTNRTLLKTDANMVPGYYGPRGFTAMSEVLGRQFDDTLREGAVHQTLISARGSVAFMQMVLLPEVAVRLIMEDLIIDEEAARDVMLESAAIGELIHDDVRQVVMRQDDNEPVCLSDD